MVLKRSTSFAEPMQSGVRWSMLVITVSSTEPAAGNMTATPSNRHGIAQFSAFTRRKRATSTYMRAAAASKQHPPQKRRFCVNITYPRCSRQSPCPRPLPPAWRRVPPDTTDMASDRQHHSASISIPPTCMHAWARRRDAARRVRIVCSFVLEAEMVVFGTVWGGTGGWSLRNTEEIGETQRRSCRTLPPPHTHTTHHLPPHHKSPTSPCPIMMSQNDVEVAIVPRTPAAASPVPSVWSGWKRRQIPS